MKARLQRTAEKFWEAASHIRGCFPRDIESAVAWSVPVSIVRLPNLWIHDVEGYLRQRQLPATIGSADRPLHGCVVAFRGKGLIVVDGTDGPRDLRFTIAHEVAHFLLDYQAPRLRAIERLGVGITEVIDGTRSPRRDERIDALLANAPLGLYAHLMHRNPREFPDPQILEAEGQADRLGLELLAPEAIVRRSLPRDFIARDYGEKMPTVKRVLTRRFGLPTELAEKYAATLCRLWFGGVSVQEWLR